MTLRHVIPGAAALLLAATAPSQDRLLGTWRSQLSNHISWTITFQSNGMVGMVYRGTTDDFPAMITKMGHWSVRGKLIVITFGDYSESNQYQWGVHDDELCLGGRVYRRVHGTIR